VPTLGNVAAKVRMRFGGFFTEVLPLLVVMSVAVRIVIVSGWLEAVHGLGPLTHRLFGIPAEAFVAVLVTMVQRYLAPLVLLNVPMSPREATIAIAMITLSLPCLPVMVMTAREAGWRVLAGVLAMAAGVSMSVGIVLNLVLPGG
ncbi:MAG: nucleoside recognition domain-containing protein, partial [Syntrophomonadaceae bacterium]|nr:nucleoside recognition domain-containing protein [Syntrophomonadaceae bacterium]